MTREVVDGVAACTWADLVNVVREVAVTYESPVKHIGELDVIFWVDALGGTSARFGFRVQSGEVVQAYGHRTIVKVDAASGTSAAWSEGACQMLADELQVTT